jgi:phosphoglycolate phosphatase
MRPIEQHLANKAHVIWDWNGTLLSDIEHAVKTVNRLLREENLKETTIEQYKKVFGFPVVDYYKKLGFDTSQKKFNELCERFNDYFHSELHSCQLWPGVTEVLSTVRGSGRKQSVLSASEQSALDRSIDHYDLRQYFDHVFGIADNKAASKVERGHELMRTAQVPPEVTILIGDTDHDLEVGQALGIDVILVEHGHQCVTRLTAKHHAVVKVL